MAITQTTTYAIEHVGDRLGLSLLGLRELCPCMCFARYILELLFKFVGEYFFGLIFLLFYYAIYVNNICTSEYRMVFQLI